MSGALLTTCSRAAGASAAAAPSYTVRHAHPADAGVMSGLIADFAARGLMLPKSPLEIVRHVRDYVVVEGRTGGVAACGGLRLYTQRIAEVVALAVDPALHGRGFGAVIVRRLLVDAEALGVEAVFAMALHPGFFHRLGFRTTDLDRIPEKVAADCRSCARRESCREVAVGYALQPSGEELLPVRSDPASSPAPVPRPGSLEVLWTSR